MRHFSPKSGIIFAMVVMGLLFPTSARAEVQTSVEYQKLNHEEALNTIKVDWWATDALGLRAGLDFGDTGLSAAVLYRQKTENRFIPYLGIGVRDLLDSSGKDLSTLERMEWTAGIEMQVTDAVAAAVETRFVPLNRDNHPEMKPLIGFSLKWLLQPKIKVPGSPEKFGHRTMNLLARLITAEAGHEPYEGQVAVGAVVINRIKSGEFPKTVREIVYQEGQFSSLPKLSRIKPSVTALRAARAAVSGADPTSGALYFYNPVTCKPEALRWFNSPQLTVTTRIGGHVFLKPAVK